MLICSLGILVLNQVMKQQDPLTPHDGEIVIFILIFISIVASIT